MLQYILLLITMNLILNVVFYSRLVMVYLLISIFLQLSFLLPPQIYLENCLINFVILCHQYIICDTVKQSLAFLYLTQHRFFLADAHLN